MTDTKAPFEVTAEDVEQALFELAQERPGVYTRKDEVESGCVNVEEIDGTLHPSCIVGSYFSLRVGIDNVEPSGNVNSTVEDLLEKGLITITPEAHFMLSAAQRLQDTRKVTWEAISETIFSLRYAALGMHKKLNAAETIKAGDLIDES